MTDLSPSKACRIVRVALRAAAGSLAAIAVLASAGGCRMVSTGRNVDGVRYFQQGQYPVALQRFDAAMTIDPRNPDTYYNKGAVLHRMGLATRDQNTLVQAESFYQQCLAMDPNHVDCHRGLAVLLTETGRVNEAFTLVKNWTARSPQNADAQVELARLYEEYSDPRSAETALHSALAVDLRNWRAHAALGRLREQSGDVGQAMQNYQTALSLNRFQPQLEQRIASLQSQVGPTQPGLAPAPTATAGTRTAAGPEPFRRY
jgi:Tfp pilus assembly protein PilF